MARKNFFDVKEGDIVTRLLAEEIPMKMSVTRVSDLLIHCGIVDEDDRNRFPGAEWTFDRATGVEEDHDLGWGVEFGVTGSRLIEVEARNE